MKSSGSVVIDCPIDDVFRIATERMPEWSKIVVSDDVVVEKPDKVGTIFKTVTEDRGRRMEFDGVVTRHQPPQVSAVQLTGKMFDIDTEFLFEDLSGRTRVVQNAQVKGKGLFVVIMFFMGVFMKKAHCEAANDELNCLKQFCEQQVIQRAG